MIAPQKIRFAMIGTGAIAQTYAQAFQKTQAAQLVAVADVRSEAAEAMASTYGLDSFSNIESLCEESSFEAAVICTPPSTHPEIACELMQRGIHVLCEKPLAINSAQAERMITQAEESGVRFTMGSKFRYVDDVMKAKAIVTSGILGEIVLFENAFTAHVDMSSRWNSNPEISGGGVLIDNGTHSVDIMRYFLGPIAELQVVEGKRIQNLPVEDTVRMFVRSEDGVMGSIDLSWSINKGQSSYINIYGSNGTINIGWKGSKYRRSSDEDWISFGSGYNKFDAFQNQLDNFAKTIRGEESLLITPADGLASVQVIETAYEALRDSSWTQVVPDAFSKNDSSRVNGRIQQTQQV